MNKYARTKLRNNMFDMYLLKAGKVIKNIRFHIVRKTLKKKIRTNHSIRT